MKRWIVYIVLLLGIASCGTLVYKRQITGNYYLIAVDSMEDLGVCYHNASDIYTGIGGHGVYEVGNDEHFIITKKYKEVPRTGRDSFFTTYDKCIFDFCGVTIFDRRMYRVAADSSAEQRENWLEEVKSMINNYFLTK